MREELEGVARDVRNRVLRWLRTRALVDRSDSEEEPNALDACTQSALAAGTFAIALYEALGFRDIAAYAESPVPGARFMELQLL